MRNELLDCLMCGGQGLAFQRQTGLGDISPDVNCFASPSGLVGYCGETEFAQKRVEMVFTPQPKACGGLAP